MIGFFPIPYPDEILYSVFARYHFRARNRSVASTGRQLFGHEESRFPIDFPNKLGYLVFQLPAGHSFTVDRLIDNHTLFPFYSPFLPSERVKQLRKDMTERSVGGAIHGRIGILTSNLQVEYIRFCPLCVKNDFELYGESYWHRVHQLPGIFVCPHHSVFLENSAVNVSFRSKKTALITAKQTVLHKSPNFLDLQNRNHLAHLFLAEQGYWLLQQNEINYAGPDFFRSRFLQILFRRGLASFKKVAWVKKIHKLFEEFYDSEFLSILSCELQNKYTWLRRLLQSSNHFQHPIRNLLLLHFLGISIKDFLQLPEIIYPFGKPPYPCLNPASDHYLELRIPASDISKAKKSDRIMGTFSCDCGFVYRRDNWDDLGKRFYEYDRIISYGQPYYERLFELKEKGFNTNIIASTLGFPEELIKRQLKNISENNSSLERRKKLSIHKKQKKLSVFRFQWLKLLSEHPNINRANLRLLNPKAYSWLYLNDRIWFEKNTPLRKSITGKENRINWNDRDNELSIRAESLALELLYSSEKPVKVSVTGIAHKLGIAHVVHKRPECIPKTIQMLKKYAESTEEFIVRRIQFSTDCFIREKTLAIYTQLIKRAGLMQPHLLQLPKVQYEINASLSKIKDAYSSGWSDS